MTGGNSTCPSYGVPAPSSASKTYLCSQSVVGNLGVSSSGTQKLRHAANLPFFPPPQPPRGLTEFALRDPVQPDHHQDGRRVRVRVLLHRQGSHPRQPPLARQPLELRLLPPPPRGQVLLHPGEPALPHDRQQAVQNRRRRAWQRHLPKLGAIGGFFVQVLHLPQRAAERRGGGGVQGGPDIGLLPLLRSLCPWMVADECGQ